nr:glycoside hydrolase domain-containing protein [Spiroplasma clarkii]
MLIAEKLGADGFTRFAYEGYRNSITSDGDVDNSATKEPGDSYLMYPTYYLQNTMPSIRLFNIQEAYNLVKKMRVLFANGDLTEASKIQLLSYLVNPKTFKNTSNYMFANDKNLEIKDVDFASINGMIEYLKISLTNKGA